jgi:hypothetical protein
MLEEDFKSALLKDESLPVCIKRVVEEAYDCGFDDYDLLYG